MDNSAYAFSRYQKSRPQASPFVSEIWNILLWYSGWIKQNSIITKMRN